jgi:hypothetical protein
MRFAGDFFGVPLMTPEEEQGSVLTDYFPELRQVGKSSQKATDGSRGYGNTRAVSPFTGFKTMEGSYGARSAPKFFGFKTFDQP